jgi:hypothetical protein
VRSGSNAGEVKEHFFSVVDCCRHPVKREQDRYWENYLVDVWRSTDSGHTFFGNVKRCGSVWTCTICAARITEKRRKELQEALENWSGIGGRVYLLTLTIPHHAGQETAAWRDQLLKAYKKMRNRTFWRELERKIGLEGSVRALEVTYGNNGAHVHIHILLFCTLTTETRPLSASDLLPEWQSACVAVGLPEPNLRGVDVRDGTYAARYVGKWGLDCELTKSHVKRGNAGGRTPWDLLKASADGDVEAGRLFVEYAVAFFGQRQLVWSTGFRKKVLLTREKTDQELAEEATEDAELVAEISPDDWERVLQYDAQASVLIAAEKGGSEGVTNVLCSLRNRSNVDRKRRNVWWAWRN